MQESKVRHEKPRYTQNWLGNELAAEILAGKIRHYWLERGYPAVKVWVESRQRKLSTGQSKFDYFVRSNMFCGFPPREGTA